MYLIDKEIRDVLLHLNIETSHPEHPFLADEQIQPCSIDIRLSNIFWLPVNKRSKIDLRKSKLAEMSPRRHWRPITLKPNECHTIRPGEMLLGRTYEKFSMPSTLAGMIVGRSSFARMGLAVHCTGGFINPGWSGYMPLQLINLGPHSIKVFPYLPVCQLMLIKLSETPENLYGERELQSKYMEDDGGPSYWWRDKRIKRLHVALQQSDVTLAIQQDLLETVGVQEPEILARFENFVEKRPIGTLESSEILLDQFSRSEDWRRSWNKLLRWANAVPLALTGSLSVRFLFERPYVLHHYIIWAVTLLSLLLAARAFIKTEEEYLGSTELKKIRKPDSS